MLLTIAAVQASLRISVCLNLHCDPAPSVVMAPQLRTLLYSFCLPVSAAETQLKVPVPHPEAGHFCGIIQGTCNEGYRRLHNTCMIILPFPWPAGKPMPTKQPQINTPH